MMRAWRRRRRALVCRATGRAHDGLPRWSARPRDRERLEAHLADCPHCSEYLAQLRITIDSLGHVDPDEIPEDAVDELVALYRRWQAG